ncbi:MAG: ATP-binding protein, partial [Chitinophagaceae bacterium]
MNIILRKLQLTNFKGIKNLSCEFSHETFIYGENATGKTTVMDAFLWLLFGKDSTDRKDFEVKTLDKAGNVIEKTDHEVYALLDVDGRDIELKRVLREKWQKKRGSVEAEFTGNETLYFWNDVPCQQKEFQAKINNLVDESIFKLLTSPLYFNSLPWQNRRDVLIGIAGDVTDAEVLDAMAT